MLKIARRGVVAAAGLFALSACADPPPRPRVTWVHLRAAESSYDIYVDEEQVQPDELAAVVLAHAMAANPGRSADEVRQNVRIYFTADPGAPYEALSEMRRRTRFEKTAIVAEDRRS